jgi:hypothetical protein
MKTGHLDENHRLCVGVLERSQIAVSAGRVEPEFKVCQGVYCQPNPIRTLGLPVRDLAELDLSPSHVALLVGTSWVCRCSNGPALLPEFY